MKGIQRGGKEKQQGVKRLQVLDPCTTLRDFHTRTWEENIFEPERRVPRRRCYVRLFGSCQLIE